METLTLEQVDRFHRDGYLRFGKVVENDELERLRGALSRVIAAELAHVDDSTLPPEFAYGHARRGDRDRKGERAIHQFVNMWKVAPEFRAVLDNPIVTGAIRDLMAVSRIRLWHDQVISKPPGDNALFSCHHDFYFWPLDRPTMITCWLALDS